ncbi:MAG: ComF family protein [Spirochaetales bacterium]|nr:ComF family protein [Spirochaetales bacterium]
MCGQVLLFSSQPGIPLCEACRKQIKPLEGRRCAKCSMPLISEHMVCTRCREQDFHFHSNFSLFEYCGAVKEILYSYKFRGIRRFAELFAHMTGKMIKTHYPGLPIIPVPPAKRKRRRKGGNHLKPILAIITREYGIPLFDCLEKKIHIPQKVLDFQNRKENLKGNIVLRRRKICDYSHIILFDDIFTTGATADECSRVLLEAGVKRIYVVTLAIDK